MKKKIVIIPTYNEIENIEDMIRSIFALPYLFDILIVDDASPDGTAKQVRQLQETFKNRLYLKVREEKRGLGTAYIEGFQIALRLEYDYIFEMDADFSHNPKDLSRLMEPIEKGVADMVIGSRYVEGISVSNWPLSRILISYFANIYIYWVTGMKIYDATAGFICYKKKVLQSIDLEKISFVGYAFQIQMKFLIWKKKFRIVEIPIIFVNRKKGASKMSMNIFKEAFIGVWKMRFFD